MDNKLLNLDIKDLDNLEKLDYSKLPMTSGVLNAFMYSFLFFDKKNILESKRYQRHKDRCRQQINQFIAKTFVYTTNTSSSKPIDHKTGEYETVFHFINNTLMSYYNNYCLITLLNVEHIPESIDTFSEHMIPMATSAVLELLKELTLKYKDDLMKEIDEVNDEVNKRYQQRVAWAESDIEKQVNKDDLLQLYRKLTLHTNSAGVPLIFTLRYKNELWNDYMHFIYDHDLQSDVFYNIKLDIPDQYELFNTVFDNTFYKFVYKRCYSNKNINMDNYISYIKLESDFDILDFLTDLFYDYRYEVENVLSRAFAIAEIEEKTEKHINQIKDQLNENTEKIKQEYEIYKESNKSAISETSFAKLQNQINAEKLSKKSLEKSMLSQITDLNKQNKELQEKINQLEQQYQDALNYIDTYIEKDDINIDTKDIQLDPSKRYIFVTSKGHENDYIFKNIKQELPNASFYFDNFNVNVNSTDLVIFLTFWLKHSVYYTIKNQCKAKNIPFVHCSKHDLLDIKQNIAKVQKNIQEGIYE